MAQSTSRLIRRGHSLNDIADYTISQFLVFLDAVEETEAQERLDFVSDISVVVGSLFSKDSPITDHITGLLYSAAGAKNVNTP